MQIQKFIPSAHPPLRDNDTVLVLRDDQASEKRTPGGLVIPGQSVELANQGEVRASAEGSSYQVGERVIFVKYAGATLELNGVEYILIKEKELQGRVTLVEVPDAPSAPRELSPEENAKLQAALKQFEETGRG